MPKNDQFITGSISIAYIQPDFSRCGISKLKECGNAIVVLLDSLTRLARAFNLSQTPARGRDVGRSLSDGLDASALEIPRRCCGPARAGENGDSVMLLATLLVSTGARMDEPIYEEFKSTCNSEIVLDRSLAQEQIFPAIDVRRAGTRKEERLYNVAEMTRLTVLRRTLAGYPPRQAPTHLLKLLALKTARPRFARSHIAAYDWRRRRITLNQRPPQ